MAALLHLGYLLYGWLVRVYLMHYFSDRPALSAYVIGYVIHKIYVHRAFIQRCVNCSAKSSAVLIYIDISRVWLVISPTLRGEMPLYPSMTCLPVGSCVVQWRMDHLHSIFVVQYRSTRMKDTMAPVLRVCGLRSWNYPPQLGVLGWVCHVPSHPITVWTRPGHLDHNIHRARRVVLFSNTWKLLPLHLVADLLCRRYKSRNSCTIIIMVPGLLWANYRKYTHIVSDEAQTIPSGLLLIQEMMALCCLIRSASFI